MEFRRPGRVRPSTPCCGVPASRYSVPAWAGQKLSSVRRQGRFKLRRQGPAIGVVQPGPGDPPCCARISGGAAEDVHEHRDEPGLVRVHREAYVRVLAASEAEITHRAAGGELREDLDVD